MGLKLASLGGGSSEALDLDAIKEEQAAEVEAEEQRVFYVAMTRAEKHLVLSGATDLEKWPEHRELGPPIAWIWRAWPRAWRTATPAGPCRCAWSC